ncbi:MAG: hypothetical protein AAGI08_01385 [Bacteroidota bacterium]
MSASLPSAAPPNHPPNPRPTDQGAALVLVLVLIGVLGMIAGSLLLVRWTAYATAASNVDAWQARYLAEAGIERGLHGLGQEGEVWPADTLVAVAGSLDVRIETRPFGLMRLVRSHAEAGRREAFVRVLAGERPAPLFEHALVLWGPVGGAGVTLNGATQLRGDVAVVAPAGLALDTTTTLDGQGFTGHLNGLVQRYDSIHVPAEFEHVHELLDRYDALIDTAQTRAGPPAYTSRSAARWLPEEMAVTVFKEEAMFSSADSAMFRHPRTVVVRGDAWLDGPLKLEAGTRLLVSGTLHVGAGVESELMVGYGAEGVVLEAGVRTPGQWMSRRSVSVRAGAQAEWPSVLAVAGDGAEAGEGIVIEGMVEGTVVHPPLSPEPAVPHGRVRIGAEGLVRGIVLNGAETDLAGTVMGSLVSRQTHRYYRSETVTGTHLINWLIDAEIDLTGRPADFVGPARLLGGERFEGIRQESVVDEVAK